MNSGQNVVELEAGNGEVPEEEDSGSPLIFVSHKHADAVLAQKLSDWITGLTGGHVNVFSSSDSNAERPTIGEDLDTELAKNLWRAGIVILLYTYDDHDWSYCAWECGVALNPIEKDTRIVCLQCLDQGPRIQENRVRVVVGDEQSMIDFAKMFGNPEFYPKHDRALSGMSESMLIDKGKELHRVLVDELPADPLENWSAWPFLRIEIPLTAVNEIKDVDAEERIEKGKQVLETVALIKEASESALRLFGKNSVPGDTPFAELLQTWHDRNASGSDDWIYTLSQQLVDSCFQDLPRIREWSRFRQVDGDGEHVIAVGRVKRRVACLVFDCYICRIVDVGTVGSLMNRIQRMYYKDLDDIEPENLTLESLLAEMDGQCRTRLPVIAERKARMIIHASMIDRFVRQSAYAGVDVNSLTLADLLADETMHQLFSQSFICVDREMTVHAAADLLNKSEGSQDIFVTESGDAGGGRARLDM